MAKIIIIELEVDDEDTDDSDPSGLTEEAFNRLHSDLGGWNGIHVRKSSRS